jgi:hypothetical protein
MDHTLHAEAPSDDPPTPRIAIGDKPMVKLSALLGLLLAPLIAAPVAHADEQAFLNDTQDVVMEQGAKLAAGYHACVNLRGGMPIQQVQRDGFFYFNLINGANVRIVEAAQRDLCPDTIH